MNVLLALVVVSLFTPFKMATAVAVVRPFDALVAILFVLSIMHLGRLRTDRSLAGLLILLPYLGCHALSAFGLSSVNGLRETIQVAIILMFAASLFIIKDMIDFRKVGRYLLIGLFAVMLYNAGYHIAIGYTGGWKTLGDAKLSMTFLPVVLGIFLLFRPGWRFGLILWLVTGAVILLSGERKALIVFAILSALVFGRGRIVVMAAMLAFGAQAVQLFALATSNDYLTRQIGTIFNPTASTDASVATLLAGGGSAESLSNAQRLFALRISEGLFSEHPLFGVGTNYYVNYIRMTYPYAPEYLLLGIHGEFQRVAVENGLLGLGLYLTIFAVSIGRMTAVIREIPRHARRTYILTALVLLIPSLLSLSLEAAATRSFLVLVVLSLAPDLMRRAAEVQGLVARGGLGQRAPRRAPPARRPAVAVGPRPSSVRRAAG